MQISVKVRNKENSDEVEVRYKKKLTVPTKVATVVISV